MKEDFQSRGTRPVEMKRLKMWQSGETMDAEVALKALGHDIRPDCY